MNKYGNLEKGWPEPPQTVRKIHYYSLSIGKTVCGDMISRRFLKWN